MSFFSILQIGITRMLQEQNYAISSYRTLEEAFGRGVLAVKEKIAVERLASALPDNYVPNLMQMAFPNSGFMRNRESGTLETRITWNIEPPQNFNCAELHVFLDNSADAYKHLLDCLKTVANKVPFEDAVILEIVGPSDPRICSAILSLYGSKGLQLAHGIAAFLDQRLHQQRRGYPTDILYPPKTRYWSSHCFGVGRFQMRKQELFRRLFMALYGLDILHLQELKMQFDAVKTGFSQQEARQAS